MIKVERIYHSKKGPGARILIDRLWPRGLSKADVKIDLWLKEIGPTDELRKWFGHDPGRWAEFKRKYFRELDGKRDLAGQIAERAEAGDVVLLFGAKDEARNNAVALKEYLERRRAAKA